MSCIRFTPEAHRQRLRQAGAVLSNEEAAVLHLSPPVTPSKIARLRALAQHPAPGIRESVASNRHAPPDLLERLAADPVDAVRAGVARNESAPEAALLSLAEDRSARVRSWLVVNPATPQPLIDRLAHDRDATVRRLVQWRAEGARQEAPQAVGQPMR